MKKAQPADLFLGILFMLLAAFWYYHASQFRIAERGIGSGGYPKFVSASLFFLGLILTVQSLIKGLSKLEIKIDRKAAVRQIIFFASTFAYIELLRYLGFIVITPLYLFFECWLFGYRKYISAAVMSIGLTAGLYIVFRMIFFVMLPEFRLF